MRGILYKEFVLSRAILLLMLFVIAVIGGAASAFSVSDDGSDPMVFSIACVFSFFLCSMVYTEIFRHDEKKTWISFAASSPQSLRGHMAAKYIYAFSFQTAVLIIWLVIAAVLSASVPDGADRFTPCVLIFSVFIFFSALEMPFFALFGMERGASVKAFSIGVLVFAVIVYLLFGDISFLLDDDLDRFITELFSESTRTALKIIIPAGAAALYVVSYFISAALYRRGAENYE